MSQAASGVDLGTGARGRQRLWAQARFWLAVALVLTGLVFWTRASFAIPPNTIAAGPLPLVLAMVSALAYASMGLLLSLRRPEVLIGAIEAWVGVMIGGLALAWAYLAFATSPVGAGSAAAPYVALVAAVLITPVIVALAVGLVLLFPTDSLLSPTWRRVAWLAGAGAVVAGIGRLFRPGALTFVGNYENPLGIPSLGALPGSVQILGYVALGVAAVLAGVSVVQRYVGGGAVERAQLRVFAAVTSIGAVAFVLFVGMFLLPDSAVGVRDGIVVVNLVVVAVGPFALALAIARYRLWDMDHLVGRTFVYGALTAILAGVYAASLRLFQTAFVTVTGQDSDAALVITTLILATTFTPIKERLEKVVTLWSASRAPAATGAPIAGTAAEAAVGAASTDAVHPAAPVDPLADPAFVAVLDARIRAVLRDHQNERPADTGSALTPPG